MKLREDLVWTPYSNATPLTDVDVTAAEVALDVVLPTEFLDLMRRHQGMIVEPSLLVVDGRRISLGHLSYLTRKSDGEEKNNLVSWATRYRKNGYSNKLIPFAQVGGAPHFALDYRVSETSPTVAYLYPDPESPDTGYWASMHIANSVLELLDMLEEDVPSKK